MALLID